MEYITKLKQLKKDLGAEYKCKFKTHHWGTDYNLTSYRIKTVDSKISPMLIVDFGEVGIFFAEPNLVLDRYDKEAIREDNEFSLGETYNIKLMAEFLKSIKA